LEWWRSEEVIEEDLKMLMLFGSIFDSFFVGVLQAWHHRKVREIFGWDVADEVRRELELGGKSQERDEASHPSR